MSACLRLARRHEGLTGTNPSVGTLLVQFHNGEPVVVGRGVTALGGRPHAESVAIAEAGIRAHGATAFVSLEPCSHHGVTPPCAQALIDAGVARVFTAWIDPDSRVDGKGHAMLKAAGIDVQIGLHGHQAERDLAGYLTRKTLNRPHVHLKLAVSRDGKIGIKEDGQIPITGAVSRAQVHRMRSLSDAILVGAGTLRADDPELTCRLPGLEKRSPKRFVLAGNQPLPMNRKLFRDLTHAPTFVVAGENFDEDQRSELSRAGVNLFSAEFHNGTIALPELLDDMAQTGISTLFVEGGSAIASAFLNAGLVDRLSIFMGPAEIGGNGVAAPITEKTVPDDFVLERTMLFSEDRYSGFNRR
ncbi:MAG: bifunctional diaminohydroxyphosphoribosylaminopyrimidine deaminase/5-amino-6-(5-phosphoribosylamino)uracil reductase RibD [Pseudomonadota bacterium]